MSRICIFISHQQQDSRYATLVKDQLDKYGIECYLDVIDPDLRKGEEIADYILKQLDKCSHLLAVVSHATKDSWWVPWEIGVATEKDYPLASFGQDVDLPEYLKKWPYLKNLADLDKYAQAVKQTSNLLFDGLEYSSESENTRSSSTKQFYKTLRSKLGQ